MFCVKLFLLSSSSSFAVLKRCGAFLIVLMTFFTLGLTALSFADRWLLAPPSASAMVGKVELLLLALLFRFNEPSRKERDNERDSGLNLFNVDEVPDELDDESATFLSSSVVTNLSRSAKSVAFGGCCCALLPEDVVVDDDAIVFPSISESYTRNDKKIVSGCCAHN